MFRKAVLLALVSAVATSAQVLQGWNDTTLAQYLLATQQVGSALFTQGLDQFADTDFADAGYPAWVRNRIEQIADHEAAHVADLTETLGADAPAPCTYTFPLTDVDSFIDLAQRVTTTASSAGIGTVGFVNGTGLAIYAASIAASESRHAGWLTSAVEKRQPWNSAWETPLAPSEVWSLLSTFVSDCPATNPTLPFQLYPALTVYPAYPTADGTVFVSLTLKAAAQQFYLAWLDGLLVQYSPIADGQATVPEGLTGTAYAVVVSSPEPPSRDNIASGLAIVQFPFDSYASDTDPGDLPKKASQVAKDA
ncbi:hypothetical protein BN946_scf184922.g5 [Trametes cinnabarina]|uniref:Protein rds1 n=1 Tax=Pycnoporus cinnabarinus TaxID=5643 RepID=A0A060SN76_PYCCI|nr:hypothetical protein BN946_scf184922.g5 [Trametes cinnabarina]